MRERHEHDAQRLERLRITPARAGKTGKDAYRKRKLGDHPRSCGKDAEAAWDGVTGWGSPPLVRERQSVQFVSVIPAGITPARAGKTPVRAGPSDGRQDHPRSCGKDTGLMPWPCFTEGSPPLVRERHSRHVHGRLNDRITPARAGKTPSQYQTAHDNKDHPRSCGKDMLPAMLLPPCVGSPPLVRERPSSTCVLIASAGITPARAGKT